MVPSLSHFEPFAQTPGVRMRLENGERSGLGKEENNYSTFHKYKSKFTL